MNKGAVAEFTIVTGKGLHSVGNPKILPAVKELLTDFGMSYQDKPGHFIADCRT